MAFYFVIFEYLWCHFLFWLWIRVDRFSAHTHVHLHSISFIFELHLFRRKCWLRSREIIISAMASSECQFFNFPLFTRLDLPSTASFFNFTVFILAYAWLPVQTRLNSSNRFNHLGLLILKSLASIQREFFFFTNAEMCNMQMPWSVLPMRYATIVPQHAIDRLLTTDLDVNFLWMQTKCDASLDFSFLMQMLFTKMQMRNVHMMQMSHAGV